MPRSGLSPAFSPNNMRDVRVIYANEAKDALAHLSSPIVRDSPRIPNPELYHSHSHSDSPCSYPFRILLPGLDWSIIVSSQTKWQRNGSEMAKSDISRTCLTCRPTPKGAKEQFLDTFPYNFPIEWPMLAATYPAKWENSRKPETGSNFKASWPGSRKLGIRIVTAIN